MIIKANLAPKKGARGRSEARQPMRLSTSGRAPKVGGTEVLIHDLSTRGMLIEAAAGLAQGDALEVELPRTGLRCAQIVWASGRYYGCQFAEPVSPAAVSAALLKSAPEGIRREAATVHDIDIGSRISTSRKSKGWSLDELAHRLGVSRQAVWYWETGQRVPRADLFKKIASVLNVTEQHLLKPEPGSSDFADATSIEQCKSNLAAKLGVPVESIRILVEL